MTSVREKESMKDSFLDVPEERSNCASFFKRLDIFSFVPFPKN